MIFEGKKIRDAILQELKLDVDSLGFTPVLSVIWIGDDFASARYIEAKQRAAEKIGIHFDLIKYSNNVSLAEVRERIIELNRDPKVSGIMVQLPVPKHFDTTDLVSMISPAKDIDGLRYCSNLDCDFHPPVTLSILRAIAESGIDLSEASVCVIGKGYLVGSPMARILENKVKNLCSADSNTPYLGTMTVNADVIISATGVASLIKSKYVKSGVVLVDAGTTEVGGKLAGDIDPACYTKARYYTPVPGGIGPVTVAMLMQNVVLAAKNQAQQNNK